MFCQQCGETIPPDVVFCPACGHQQPVISGAVPPPLPTGNGVIPAPPFRPPVEIKASGGQWISEGWEVVKTDIGLFMGLSLLYVIVGAVGSVLTHGPMQAGFHLACMRKLVRGRTEVADLIQGFNYFLPAFVAALLISLFSFIGFLLCIIPGFIVMAVYMFTYLFIVDKRLEFWPAMEASHAIIKQDYMGFVLFMLGLGLLNLVGLLCCIVGVFVTIPISMMAITIAYRELIGFEPDTV
ncbi:MAG: zinc-ribbon domain-containing protein [Bryobacteraceae bacterium]